MVAMDFPGCPDISRAPITDAPVSLSTVEVALPQFSEWLRFDIEREANDRASESVAMALARAQVSFPDLAPAHLGSALPPGEGHARVRS